MSSAASGTVYIADGAGSGSWGTVAASLNFVGMTAPFLTPIAPTGWLELNGIEISRTTYSDLWTAVTIQQSGTRSSGSAVITGLSSTTNMKAGYYVGGSGFAVGTTIVSVDSGTQITVSNNASSSGSATVIVSPWQQGNGTSTFTLPNTTTDGSFIRSRTSSVHIGTSQTDQNASHTHTITTDGSHTHGITDSGHIHDIDSNFASIPGGVANWIEVDATAIGNNNVNVSTTSATTGITVNSGGSHTHTLGTNGGTEARPNNITMLWCVKF